MYYGHVRFAHVRLVRTRRVRFITGSTTEKILGGKKASKPSKSVFYGFDPPKTSHL